MPRALRLAVGALVILTTLTAAPAPAWSATPQRLDFNTVPPPPWRVSGTVTASGGVLHVGPDGSVSVGFDPEQRGDWYGGVDNVLGWTVSARVRMDATLAGDCADGTASLILADHTIDVHLSFGSGGVCVRSTGMAPLRHAMDTQRAFHTYRLDVRRQHVALSVDGVPVLSYDAPRSNSFIGAWIELLSVGPVRTHWDFLSYDTTPSLPRCTVTGTPGDDVLTGTSGRDVICAGEGNDRVSGLLGDDVLIGGGGDDQLFGGAGRDVLLGQDGFDFLQGDGGNDSLYGGPSDDTFHATRPYPGGAVADGTDTMVGGEGSDTADYSRRLEPVRVTLDDFANDGAPGENDRVGVIQWQTVTWPDVENVTGGSAGDVIVGSNANNVLVGLAGADTVRGLGGNDTIDVLDRAPVDTVNAGSGRDLCVADQGDALTSCEL